MTKMKITIINLQNSTNNTGQKNKDPVKTSEVRSGLGAIKLRRAYF